MKYQQGTFQANEKEIYYQYWLPESQIRGCLMIVHGLHEHSGRYQPVAEYFTNEGFAVYGVDLPGHGKSQGIRSFIPSYSEFSSTLDAFLQLIQKSQPGMPIFLMGHSLGGLIGATFLIDHQECLQGAILSGSLALVPDYVNSFTQFVGKILSQLLPKFRLLEIDKTGISRDPAVVAEYLNDPLVFQGKITARLSGEINQAISRLAEQGSRIEIPLLLLHGSDDRLSDPACSRHLLELASSVDKELIIYQDFYHEIYNEPDASQVFQDVLTWLNRQVKR